MYVYVKIHSILKRKNNGLIPHWKIRVSYRSLKLVLYIQEFDPFKYTLLLCIQKLGTFEYTPLLISLNSFLLSPCVCVS